MNVTGMRQGGPDEVPIDLFCFAHAGGGSRIFRGWQAALGPGVRVRPVILPGRESKGWEAPFTRMAPLVRYLGEELAPRLHSRFAFFGHSLGAAVAYETAQRLRELGLAQPACLIVSARRAPYQPIPTPHMHQLDDAHFIDEITSLNGIPLRSAGRTRALTAFLPTIRADYELNETYVREADPYLTCPVIGYAGDRDPVLRPRHLLAWHAVTEAPFRLRTFAGDHFYFQSLSSDFVAALRTDLGVRPAMRISRFVAA